jgi:hypothetical protein
MLSDFLARQNELSTVWRELHAIWPEEVFDKAYTEGKDLPAKYLEKIYSEDLFLGYEHKNIRALIETIVSLRQDSNTDWSRIPRIEEFTIEQMDTVIIGGSNLEKLLQSTGLVTIARMINGYIFSELLQTTLTMDIRNIRFATSETLPLCIALLLRHRVNVDFGDYTFDEIEYNWLIQSYAEHVGKVHPDDQDRLLK